jgi:hypothetical protein
VVEEQGFLSLHLSHGVTVDLTPDLAVRLRNPAQWTGLALAADGSQLAVEHPTGRLLQYGPRIEVQVEDAISVKNAKVYPRGTSFTANNFALVYMLDEGGPRTTSDMFHDLHAGPLVDVLFEECVSGAVPACLALLEALAYWQEDRWLHCWAASGIRVLQAADGLVQVERQGGHGGPVQLRASPANGRLRVATEFLQATASLGEEAHVFLRQAGPQCRPPPQVRGPQAALQRPDRRVHGAARRTLGRLRLQRPPQGLLSNTTGRGKLMPK